MVVLDANVVISLTIDEQRAAAIEPHMRSWTERGETLHAPSLMRYEVASALTRSIVGGTLDPVDAEAAWRQIAAMPITLHELLPSWRRRSSVSCSRSVLTLVQTTGPSHSRRLGIAKPVVLMLPVGPTTSTDCR